MSLDSRLMMEYEMLRHTNDSELETCALTDQEIQELKVKWETSLESDHKELFAKIKARDHTQVEKILAEKGTKVEIIPKLGCSPIHYSKLNIANKEDEMGDSPLIMAARVDSRMVEIILKYGGNPNQGNDKENPLSVAANRYDRETITSLLRAGGNLEDAVLKLTLPLRHVSEKEMKENSEAGYCVKPLTVLLTDDVYLKCRFPIKTAFKVCKDIKKIRKVRNEFETEFELLMKEADNFAYEFLDQCDKMTEAKAILSYPVNLLKMAINQKKKQFVSHPFSQQLINERWNGDLNNTLLRGKTIIALKYITSPITLPLLFLKFLLFDLPRRIKFMKSDFTQLLKLTFTPCLCFITDAFNYLTFLAIVVCVCIFPSDGKYHLGNLDYLLYYCVLARIINEIDFLVQQGWRGYFRNFWNIVDITIVLLLCVAAIFKGLIHYRVDGLLRKHANNSKEGGHIYYRQLEEHLMLSHQDSMMVNYIYAVTEFILTLRVLGLLEISKSLGTMLIALKYLVIDVLRFGIILLTVIFGTSIAIYSMTISIHQWNKELRKSVATLFDGAENYTFSLLPYNEAHPGGEVKGPDVFETFSDTMRNIMWSTFGLLDVVNVAVEHEKATKDFINIILILYVLLSCVLLLNMLIGILGSTFDRIKENCDIEWKYARSQRLKEYSRAQPLLFPFFTLLFPFVIWFRRRLNEEQRREREKDSSLRDGTERNKLISAVCDRFGIANWADSRGKLFDPRGKRETFEMRTKLRKQSSVLMQFGGNGRN